MIHHHHNLGTLGENQILGLWTPDVAHNLGGGAGLSVGRRPGEHVGHIGQQQEQLFLRKAAAGTHTKAAAKG